MASSTRDKIPLSKSPEVLFFVITFAMYNVSVLCNLLLYLNHVETKFTDKCNTLPGGFWSGVNV